MATGGSSSAPLQTKHNEGKGVEENSRRDSDTSKRKPLTPSTPTLPDQGESTGKRVSGSQFQQFVDLMLTLQEGQFAQLSELPLKGQSLSCTQSSTSTAPLPTLPTAPSTETEANGQAAQALQ
ncbi:hypothetical protein ElyMa_000053700 [Elysia marginata]|uniref:Uncharacterized protein n=1 Tax=Elysia marginata TaxID=1093978 RepID=A0AAV4EE91_9GAST|nr:hypothetical protein ElyMa_000053700 [Elysia marginata]